MVNSSWVCSNWTSYLDLWSLKLQQFLGRFPIEILDLPNFTDVGGFEHEFYAPIIHMGMSSSQLTFILGVGIPPTSSRW